MTRSSPPLPLLAALVMLAATRAAADTLPELVTQFEPCAIICYNAAAIDAGCSPGNFGCVCTNPGSLVVKMSICVGKACDGHEPFGRSTLLPAALPRPSPTSARTHRANQPQTLAPSLSSICGEYNGKPPATEIAAASKIVVSEYSSVAATATANPVPKATNDAPAAAADGAALCPGRPRRRGPPWCCSGRYLGVGPVSVSSFFFHLFLGTRSQRVWLG